MSGAEEKVAEVDAIVEEVRPFLAKRDPHVMSAVLADLLAMWLVGWPNFAREDVLADHLDLVRQLIPPNERALFGEAGHPQNRKGDA